MKNKKIRTEESLERYKTDLAEYSFMLEQEYKKIVIPQRYKVKIICYNNNKKNKY